MIILRRHELLEVMDEEGNKELQMDVVIGDADEGRWIAESLRDIAREIEAMCDPEDEK